MNGAMTNYVLNALDQRISKENTTGRTDFSYDEQGQLAFEQSQSGHSTNYLWFAGQLVGIVRDGKVYEIATDHLGRPEVAWDHTNAVVWRAANHAFDRDVAQDRIGGLNIGFPGQYYDQETGFWYNGHRDYDPGTDRYLQPDPLGLDGGINPYLYASGNPLMKIDPLGLWSLSFGLFEGQIGSQISIVGNGLTLTSATLRLGPGLGFNLSYDPNGGNPDQNAQCGQNGNPVNGIGVFGDVGASIGPVNYSYSASGGITQYFNGAGQLSHQDIYSNSPQGGPSFSINRGFGIKLGASAGIEFTHYFGNNNHDMR